MDTGTLLAIIIVLLSMAVSLVNKVLKKAGELNVPKDDGTLPDFMSVPETVSVPESAPDMQHPVSLSPQEPSSPKQAPATSKQSAFRQTSSHKPSVATSVPESPKGGGLSIDKKKLVIYSEIMKPKWQA